MTQRMFSAVGVVGLVLALFLPTSLLSFAIPAAFGHSFTIASVVLTLCISIASALIVLTLLAPQPRRALPSEKTYLTSTAEGAPTTRQLPCWFDRWLIESRHGATQRFELGTFQVPKAEPIEPAEVLMSVVIPAYNEEGRILSTLEEAVEYLDKTYGRRPSRKGEKKLPNLDGGYEIIVVNDCSKDRTVHVALEFARRHDLHDIVRVVNLERNRGKGGAITHAFRHVRGKYVLFADADGASKFSDLAKLMKSLEKVTDGSFRGVAIGSRAHMVGSDAVVKRSALRNFLMRGFHFGLSVLTPPATSRINDTQCGFKLFTRASLPHIVPYMHAEGWIFDIEMLMLAESSPPAPIFSDDGSVIGTTQGIRVAEVPIAWHEVGGSKMNLLQDSIKMAWGLAVLRASWMFGVYSRRMV